MAGTETVVRKPSTTRERAIDPPPSNRKFGPVAKRPEGWAGIWHDPEINPKRLTEDLKRQKEDAGRAVDRATTPFVQTRAKELTKFLPRSPRPRVLTSRKTSNP